MSGDHSSAEQLAIAAREEYARQQAIFTARFNAWVQGGRQGDPPPHPVPPHIPGPGNADLVFVDQLRDNAPDEFAQMREMVKTLPLREQLRLSKLPPNRFRKEARRIIRKYEAINNADPDRLLGPNARRRAQKVRERLDTLVATITRSERLEVCELCGDEFDRSDPDHGHGLGECCDVCGMCQGSGEGPAIAHKEIVTRDMAIDAGEPDLEGTTMTSYTYDPCPNCKGLGGIRFPEEQSAV